MEGEARSTVEDGDWNVRNIRKPFSAKMNGEKKSRKESSSRAAKKLNGGGKRA